MLINLTHPLKRSSPIYVGTPEMDITPDKSIESGNSSNTSIISFSSHCGTHLDSPLHFCKNGKSISKGIPHTWTLEPAYCINLNKEPGECITVNNILEIIPEIRDAKAIIIKTGFGNYRNNKQEIYTNNNPWINPKVPAILHRELPDLVLFGIDTISISSPLHRDEGRECHRSFLCDKRPIWVLEDLNLENLTPENKRFKLTIFPYIHENIDGTPVFVIAEKNYNFDQKS